MNHHHLIIDRFKESFLCAAARGGRIEECASLLNFGANIEWRENKGDNPLLAAVRNGMNDVAALLLAHGANPGILDQDGNTVMHLAALIGDESMASLFSPNASALSIRTNNDGMTGIYYVMPRLLMAGAANNSPSSVLEWMQPLTLQSRGASILLQSI